MGYECWTNVDARFSRTYERGDWLVRGWCDVVASTDPVPRFEVLAEEGFARHNRDDRPDGQLCPSMSIGDVVMFGEVAMSVDGIGFARVDVDHVDLVVDRTWLQVIDQDRAAPGAVAVPHDRVRLDTAGGARSRAGAAAAQRGAVTVSGPPPWPSRRHRDCQIPGVTGLA